MSSQLDNDERTFTIATRKQLTGKGNHWRPVIDMSAPLPLLPEDGIRRAVQLRRGGRAEDTQFGWANIAYIMGTYHGLWYSTGWWAQKCKAMDPSLASPRGVMCMGSERVRAA